jgi:glycosyltransferase involved in cell wall biosynthesis
MTAPSPPVRISAVLPVYNSAAILPGLIDRLERVLAAAGGGFEVVCVDDGSRDESWSVLASLAAARPWLSARRLLRNYGQHNALLCGVREARGAIIVTLDDDGQHPPEEIPKLLAKLNEGFDVVYGTPAFEQHGFLRDMASRLTKLALQGAMGARIARSVSAFRAFRTPLREGFATYQGPYVSLDVLLTWSTTRFAAVTVEHRPRAAGASNYTVGRLAVHALNMMTGFSTWPLHLASLTGFLFTLFGFAVLAYVLGRYALQGGSVPGFPFLASIIAIFSGAQLFALGILGEYLARMHFRMMDRPPYVVGERTPG